MGLFKRKGKDEHESKMEEAWYCKPCSHRNECSLEYKNRMGRNNKDQCQGKEVK